MFCFCSVQKNFSWEFWQLWNFDLFLLPGKCPDTVQRRSTWWLLQPNWALPTSFWVVWPWINPWKRIPCYVKSKPWLTSLTISFCVPYVISPQFLSFSTLLVMGSSAKNVITANYSNPHLPLHLNRCWSYKTQSIVPIKNYFSVISLTVQWLLVLQKHHRCKIA